MSWRNIEPNAYAVLNLLSEAESIIVLDTETTGLAKNAKIIQFSAIRYKINADFSLEQIDFFDTYINPDEKLKAKITEITGISQDMIEKCPKEDIIAKDIVAYLSKASIYAAHNAPFDIDKINAMFERIGIEFCLPAPKVIDTLPCARDCFPDLDSYKLQDIVENIDTENQFRYHNSLEDIKKGIQEFELTKNRMDILEKNHKTIIDGTYNASVDSMKSSIDVLANYKKRKVAILADMLELGSYSQQLHEEVGNYVATKEIDVLICIGKEAKYMYQKAKEKMENVYYFTSNQEVIEQLDQFLKNDDVVLVKGSHSMNLKEIVEKI